MNEYNFNGVFIDHVELMGCSGNIETINTELSDIQEQAFRIIDSMRDKYNSEAARKFIETFNELKVPMQSHYNTINNFAAFLSKSAREYAALDDEHKALVTMNG